MSTIFLPQKSRRGDTLSGASIDRGDPLNNGLIFAFAPGATGSITKESVKGAVGSIAGTAEFRGDSFSGAKSYSENNTSWIAFPDSPELDSADITVFAIVTPRVGTGITETQVAARNYDGSKVPFNFQLYNATAVLSGFGFFDGAWKNVAFSGTFSANERVSVAGRNAGGTLAVFKNGALNNSSTGNGACPSGTAGIAVGSYVNDSVGFNGGIHCVYVWRRALSDGEIAQLHAEPFRVFSKQSRVIYFPSAGGGGAITGTGSPAAQSATVSGTATRTVTGSGTPAAQAATVSGTAEREITSSGTPAAQSATVSGTGTVGAVVTGSGAPQAQSATVAGTAERTVTASGTVAAQSATVAGTAEREITSSGTPTAQSATVVGTGQVGNIISGSGTPTAQSATVSGAAEREITASGTVSASSATVVGAAERTITGTGTLSASSATVYGFDTAPVSAGNPTSGGGIGRVYSSKKLRKEVDEWLEKQQESERQKILARIQREDEELLVIMLALAA